MAEIRPLRAWRYNDELIKSIDDLTSPLFDVVSERQRAVLYKNPLNSIHLSVPMGREPAENARETLKHWKSEGIIHQDKLPSIYVYYQYFSLPGHPQIYCRKGFIANIRIYDWDEEVILRHESTMPHSVNDRMRILEETELNVSPTHGLYTDPTHEIEGYLDEAIQSPLYETEDYQGVKDVFAVIQDVKVIRRIIEILDEKQIILADGHHRYAGSLDYKNKRQEANPGHDGYEPYNYHLMYFTNTEGNDLSVLPTHRLVDGFDQFDERRLLRDLEKWFHIKTIDNPMDTYEVILGKKWAFGLLVGDNAYKIRLKPERIEDITWNFPKAIKELDLTVMHFFIFEKILGIRGRKQSEEPQIRYERNFTECLKEVIKGEAHFAVITKDIAIETIKSVCYSGYTLPQKSTYFYPKVICGFLFSSINEDEFYSPLDSSF